MIESNEKQVLSDLVNIFSALNMPMIVVGAGARLLIFDQKFGEGRGTKDWDIAISIDSWKDYQQICEALINGDSPCFKNTRNPHKFIHIKTSIEVDIVPFGEIGEPDQKIVWSETGNSMNVLGFTEAMLSAKHITIDDFEIQVIDIPAFIVLKIFAWGDRGERTNKDLEDIDFILSKYEDDDRVFNELAEELADKVIEFLDANIYLLGQDIYKILQSKTLHELNLLLNKLLDKFDDEPESLGYKLEILKKGISSFSSDNVI
ncbi:nucleotidyl transferase AbiEii/AbiGii toxin family protein [Desmonostoc muscorum LEGE 12446]|uniref:Nucleotidyl transferase AbiEii/AbiGii toxin family protein n=1 Tax=Desmonostoc muscorum LEGE 12446 TaxID=1828758 RepID=A0A8J6ZNY9_DESMC|nr:nucleotidyl transferase AbiEii/AbiGii toxin family protein [Desmonostoc muscorum]MCF2144972.1 nucleotidyl transferase AbiEii/AbiGii toxin family protein [Desmonostoc muscorum LEGE 12446]